MPQPPSCTTIRTLGAFEEYLEAGISIDHYRGTAVTCRYVLPGQGLDFESFKDIFIHAVAQVVLHHPLLQVGLLEQGMQKPAFVRLERLNLDDMIQWRVMKAPDEYPIVADQILSEQLDKKFMDPATNPGWRLVVMRPPSSTFVDVVYTWRHTMHDGTGAKIIHQTLLSCLNSPVDIPNLSGYILTLRDDGKAFPPPMEHMGQMTRTLRYTLSTIWNELGPRWLVSKPTHTQTLWGPFKAAPVQTERRTIRLCAMKARRLVEVCRDHQTTITALIHGIAFASLYWETLSEDGRASFTSTTAMDLRRFMPDQPISMPHVEMNPQNTVANIVTVLGHKWTEDEVEQLAKMAKPLQDNSIQHLENMVWAAAKTVRADIEAKLSLGLKNDIMSLVKFGGDWRSRKAKSLGKPRNESWMVTNLGIIDGLPPDNPRAKPEPSKMWSITHAIFSICAEVGRPLFTISIITAKGGDMCIELTWQFGLSEYVRSVASRFERDLRGWLNFLTTGVWLEEESSLAFGY